MKKIRIESELRLLKMAPGSSRQLCHAYRSIEAQQDVLVGDEIEVSYDHQILWALPLVEWPGLYILARDVDPEYWMAAGRIIGDEPVH